MNKPQSNLNYKKGYGENFANLRKIQYNGKENYTVRGLAEKLNIASSTISLIEKEQRTPTIEQVNVYKDFFGVSLDYLVGETNIIKADVRKICEYTGLDESTIEILHQYAENEELKILNLLMSENDFFKMLAYLGKISEIEIMKRYHIEEINKILNESDKDLEKKGITETNYNYYLNREYRNTLDSDKLNKTAIVKVDYNLCNAINKFLQKFASDSDLMTDYRDDFEFLYERPQELREFKADKLFSSLIEKLKKNKINDKEYFKRFTLWIYQYLLEKNKKEENDFKQMTKDLEYTNCTTPQDIELMYSFLDKFKEKYLND